MSATEDLHCMTSGEGFRQGISDRLPRCIKIGVLSSQLVDSHRLGVHGRKIVESDDYNVPRCDESSSTHHFKP